MRLFVGIDIPEEIRAEIARFVDEMRRLAPDAKWVKPETFHVTLKFLGETPPQTTETLKDKLAEIQQSQFEIRFGGTGFFPNARNARVFWAGVEADEQLPRLAAKVDEACSQAGFERERNELKPHLTLARGGRGVTGNPHQQSHGTNPAMHRLSERLKAIAQPDFGRMTAQQFILYESKLGPGGARYTKLAAFPLQGV